MFTIIICTIGRQEFLSDLLESIARQTCQPAEVLFVVWGTDQNLNFFKKFEHEAGFQVVYCDRVNLGAMRNIGVQACGTEFILFSDDDDRLAPTKGELVVKELANFFCVTHNYGKFGRTNRQNLSKLGTTDRMIRRRDFFFGANVFGGGSSICGRRSLFQVIPFNENMTASEDFEWWYRVFHAGVGIKFIGEDLVDYRDHSANLARKSLNNCKNSLGFIVPEIFSSLCELLYLQIAALRAIVATIAKMAIK